MFAALMIQFAAKSFSGSESSGEVLVSIVMLGGTADRNITVPIRLTPTGQL